MRARTPSRRCQTLGTRRWPASLPRPGPTRPLNSPLSGAAVVGGLLIIIAFLLLSWATYREMNEERKKKEMEAEIESDIESVI